MTQKISAILIAAASASLMAGYSLPRTVKHLRKVPAHAVVVRVDGFTAERIVVRITSSPPGLEEPTDTTKRFPDTITVRTPAEVRVSAAVQRLELSTEGNLAIRVRFTNGASASERLLRPWGRRLLFRRVDGDLQPEAQLGPAADM